MKKFFLKIFLIAILAWGAQYLTVWYAGPLIALVVNLFWKGSNAQGFFTGFLGLGLLWFGLALYVDISTEGILTVKMSQIIAKTDNRMLMVLMSTLIGALTGGLCGWTGAAARSLKK